MRQLDASFGLIQASKTHQRAWKLYIYDFNSTKGNAVPDTLSRLVQGAELDAIVGPLDLTDNVLQVQVTERSSDFVQGNIQGSSITFNVADKGQVYDPVRGTESRWLKQGNGIVLKEGDASLDESTWATTFTGTIVGRAGASDRDRSNNVILQVAAEDRAATILKNEVTSAAFPQATDYQFMMRSILETELGFGPTEYDIPTTVGNQLTSQATTQFVDESALISLAKMGFVDGFMPRFNGAGVLVFYPNFSTKSADVIYSDFDFFDQFTRPFSPLEVINEVEIIGLESDMSKISQPAQVLASASVTLGFFGGDENIKVAWSDDRTQQADNPRLNVIQSVTGALIPFGAEDFSFSTDNDGGSRFGEIDVEGAFYAPLVIAMYAGQIAASFIPDLWAGLGGGNTIPVGRLIEAVLLILTQTVQATIGRGQYEVVGAPYEYVFKEIRGVARVADLPFIDIRGASIENHLIDTQVEADAIALRELRTARKRGNLWNCVMRHDLRLEPGDKFRFEETDEEFIITEIQRTITRDDAMTATLQLYETTQGVNP